MSDEFQPENPRLRRQARTLNRISTFMFSYAVFTLLLSLPTLALGIGIMTKHASNIFVLLLGIYGLIAVVLMLKAHRLLDDRALHATQWTRVAMAVAVPGSAITCFFAAFSLSLLPGSTDEPAFDMVLWLLGLLSVGVATASFANVVILVRVLFSDLDELLWAAELSRCDVDEQLNYIE